MDSVDNLTSRITGLVADGRPSEALNVAARRYKDPEVSGSVIFCLNAAHAAVRTELPHAIRRRLLVRYLKLVAKCPQYHKGIELSFWYMQAAVAVEQKKPVLALMMYTWVLELGPERRQAEIVTGFILRIRNQNPDIVVRDKLTRKDLVK